MNVKEKTEEFWDKNPCGTWTSLSQRESLEFFQQIERYRYSEEGHIIKIADFEKSKNKNILEIGCGIGTDLSQYAKYGAITTGIDLSSKSIELAKRRFALLGLKGTFLVTDAENLPFPNESFDLVYSYGVIHHIPNVGKVVREIYRVLKPEGEIIIGVYNRHSFFYYWNTLFLQGIIKGKLFCYSKNELIAMTTDGQGNPYAKLYTKKELSNLFMTNGFLPSKIEIYCLPHWAVFAPVGKFISREKVPQWIKFLLDYLGRIIGWFIIFKGKKTNE